MVTSKPRWLLAGGALLIAGVASWAGDALWSMPVRPAPPAASERRLPAATIVAPGPPTVSTLHEQATSAYHARLFVDGEGLVLITQAGFTTLRAGGAPEEHVLPLGPVAVRQGGAVVFWRSGKLRSVSLSGADERELATVPSAPQHLLASASELVWLQTDRQSGTSLQALSRSGQVRTVHASPDSVSAPVLHGAAVYWVTETRDAAWAIARVGLDGRPPISTRAQHGRPPAMLAVGRDGVYFYAGPQRGVRRLSFDLEQETAVASQVICSPLAVSSRVVCAQVGGLFELSPAARAPRLLASERSGPITALTATDERAYWVAEGREQGLIVRSVALAEL